MIACRVKSIVEHCPKNYRTETNHSYSSKNSQETHNLTNCTKSIIDKTDYRINRQQESPAECSSSPVSCPLTN